MYTVLSGQNQQTQSQCILLPTRPTSVVYTHLSMAIYLLFQLHEVDSR